MFKSCNLNILPFNNTHFTANSATLIDLMIVSDLSDIVHFGQFPVPGISRHDLIYSVYSIKSPKPPTKYIQYRDFKKIDDCLFFLDVENTKWDKIYQLTSVDDMVNSLNNEVLNLFNKHAPIVKKRITGNKKRPVPWMTNEILRVMAQRDSLYRKARKSDNEELLGHYKHLRNRVKQLLRNSRFRYMLNLFENKNQPSQTLWKTLKKLV